MSQSVINSVLGSTRRGGLTPHEINTVERGRAQARPVPWSALARQLGRCEADLKQHFEPKGDAS